MRVEIFALLFATIMLSTRMGTCEIDFDSTYCQKPGDFTDSDYSDEDISIVLRNFKKFCDNGKLCFDVVKNIVLERPQYRTNYTCLDEGDFKGKCPPAFNIRQQGDKEIHQIACCLIEVISSIPREEQEGFINDVQKGCQHTGR